MSTGIADCGLQIEFQIGDVGDRFFNTSAICNLGSEMAGRP